MRVKFQKKNTNLGVLDQVFCTEVQKSVNILSKSINILSPLTSNEFSVHDSFSFADEVSSLCPDHFCPDICIGDLFCDTNTIHNLDRNDMRKLLTLAAYESFFIFDQVINR